MDRFYVPDLTFDEGAASSREQWYKRCLAHPDVQDKLTCEHLVIDEKQKEVVAMLMTTAIERASGKALVEMRMNVLYNLKIDDNEDITIDRVKVFLENDPDKAAKLVRYYAIAPGNR